MRWRPALAALCCAMMLCSCEADLRDLCYDHSHATNLNVAFDWQKAPEMQPTGMTVLFYQVEQVSGEPDRYDFVGHEGGSARLVNDSYRAVAYNYDTEAIRYRGMENPALLEAYTRISSVEEGTQMASFTRGITMPRAAGTEQEPVILEPDPLCGVGSEAFTLKGDDSQRLVMMPEMRTKEVKITIHNVPNLQYTNQIGAALSGLAPSVYMVSGELGESLATETFTGAVVNETTIVMHVRIFGHCPRAHQGEFNAHKLTIYAVLADDSKWYHTVDVTDQMHDWSQNPEDAEEIVIRLDELPIPKPIVNGSGFQPTIDGWQGIEIDVGM